jgi:beta-glucosidase
MTTWQFPPDFVWGVAASAYQIEGATDADGRGPSTWDEFCSRPGTTVGGQSGRFACDHYHRWPADLDLIRDHGFQSYRFSTAWPRVVPDGDGAVNDRGLDFYDRLVDGMLARGIRPMLCLHHWDLPLALERDGGWRNRRTVEAFARYADVVARRLGDRIMWWSPINEIPVVLHEGYRLGTHAPGLREPERVIRQVAHHMLLAQGLATQAVRAVVPRATVGMIHNAHVPMPLSESPDDVAAARARFSSENDWLLHPVYRGGYPAAEWERLGADQPRVEDGDMAAIATPMDFFGLNYYLSWEVVSAAHGVALTEKHFPRTFMGWDIVEDGIYWALRFAHECYAPRQLLVTENGCGYPDEPGTHGRIDDFARIQYFRSHLRMVHRAIREGLPVGGFWVWSILDNFEWAYGYGKRFGIVHVNFETMQRTPKTSAAWWRWVIANNGL